VSTEEAEATGALLQTSDSPNSGSQSESKGDEEATPAAAVEDQSAQDQAMRDSQVFKVSVVAKTNIVFLQWPAERLAMCVAGWRMQCPNAASHACCANVTAMWKTTHRLLPLLTPLWYAAVVLSHASRIDPDSPRSPRLLCRAPTLP